MFFDIDICVKLYLSKQNAPWEIFMFDTQVNPKLNQIKNTTNIEFLVFAIVVGVPT